MSKITIDRALVEQALEALEEYAPQHGRPDDMMVAITALRAVLAQAYENGYKAGAAAEREAIMDEWSACVQSDLENGVRWLNEQAAKKWQESYPAMAGFADKIYARGETK